MSLTNLSPYLVAALSGLDVHYFTHFLTKICKRFEEFLRKTKRLSLRQ